MNKKQKGSVAERELIKMFWSKNWAAFRAAGSGSSSYPTPDLIAGNAQRKLGIEVKTVNAKIKYFTKDEIGQLRHFSHTFGCEPWVAIKFDRKGWLFFTIEDLDEKENSFAAKYQENSLKGFTFEELIKF
jgi:Holliday junction resolvase